MIAANLLGRAIRRTVRNAALPGSIPLAAADESALSRLAIAARDYARYRPSARSFLHMGKRFRLHQFDGWLIVTTWRGEPVVGPIRIQRSKA
ncbi:hypothetical protein MX652_15060 [Thauera aromatica]|nr:hypothetical protein [Thauera aromatica]MCK2128003.1 hypothetical protein [Thauera aromatica]